MTPLPIYNPGRLYPGNTLGQAILDHAVTEATFAGPPLVACLYSGGLPLFEETSGVSLLQDFAAEFAAPLILIDQPTSPGLATLTRALAAMRRFYTMSHIDAPEEVVATLGPPIFTSRFTSSTATLAGPFLAAGLTEDQITYVANALWGWANTFNRTTQFHRWGIGMQAVSGFNRLDFRSPPDSQAAPLYRAGPSLAADLKEIRLRWQNQRAATLSQIEVLRLANIGHVGLDVFTNPVNIPYVYLAAPPAP